MKRILGYGTLFVALLICVGPVSGNLVTNPSFESPLISGNFVTYNTATNLGGWSVNHIDLIRNYWNPSEGAQSIDLSSTQGGYVSQNIITTPGEAYILSFDMAGNPACKAYNIASPATKTVALYWGGNLIDSFTYDTSPYTLNAPPSVFPFPIGTYTHFTKTLVASGSSMELKFVDSSIPSSNCGAVLDNIDLSNQVIPAPEFPSAVLPMILVVGFIGTVLFIHKYKKL